MKLKITIKKKVKSFLLNVCRWLHYLI